MHCHIGTWPTYSSSDFFPCTGAVAILRNLEHINFNVLYSGKICWDEVDKVKDIVKKENVKLPKFLRDVTKYKSILRRIGYQNNLIRKPERLPRRNFEELLQLSQGKLPHEASAVPRLSPISSLLAQGQAPGRLISGPGLTPRPVLPPMWC